MKGMSVMIFIGLALLLGAGGCLYIGFVIKRDIRMFAQEKQPGVAIVNGYEYNGSDLEPLVAFDAGGKHWSCIPARGNVTRESHPKGCEVKIAYRIVHYPLVGWGLKGVELAEPGYQSKSSQMFMAYAAWVMSAGFGVVAVGLIIGGIACL